MQAIKAKWTNGRIVPAEPVDWPEGSELRVEPVETIGLDESQWRDDPQSIADWEAAVEKLEPMIWAEGEREAYERYREEFRRFNLEAVRKQMEALDNGETP